ncbi:hypothetical protein [Capnocytophaga cynodegmi]|uniref:hypothetical protein n=1 Tax=Capnocytophaga cynodegmi TaxID=28189 RepID=UPI001BB358D0|nr:hypothetical protein [Capnocytophaga cynodegmi]
MKTTSITVYSDTRIIVNKAKSKYKYKTLDDCIKEVYKFFEENDINPTKPFVKNANEIFRSDIRMYFDDLRKIQKDDSQSLRKYLGALEKNYLKPILHNFAKEEVLKAIKESREEEEPTPKIDELTKTDTPNISEIDRLKRQVLDYREARDEALRNAENYKELLKEITSKIKIVNSILGYMVCEIDISVEDYRDFKNRAGV